MINLFKIFLFIIIDISHLLLFPYDNFAMVSNDYNINNAFNTHLNTVDPKLYLTNHPYKFYIYVIAQKAIHAVDVDTPTTLIIFYIK